MLVRAALVAEGKVNLGKFWMSKKLTAAHPVSAHSDSKLQYFPVLSVRSKSIQDSILVHHGHQQHHPYFHFKTMEAGQRQGHWQADQLESGKCKSSWLFLYSPLLHCHTEQHQLHYQGSSKLCKRSIASLFQAQQYGFFHSSTQHVYAHF